MRYTDEQIDSVGGLVDSLKAGLRGVDAPAWFRGQSRLEWHLVPKLLRGGVPQSETFLISRFKQNATLLLQQHPKNDFE